MNATVQPTRSASDIGKAAGADRGTAVGPRGGIGSPVGTLDRWLGARLQRAIAPVGVRLELWDGRSPSPDVRGAVGDLVVGDRRTLLGLILHPDLWFGEAYMAGRLQIRGPVEPVVEALSRLSTPTSSWRARVAAAVARPNTLTGARHHVHHHYDLGNAFYRLWLDRELVYTCAYFADPQLSLDDAQAAKLDLVCRKLRLQPGETVVEAGCGWGALALHMARHYGVHVKAFNVSREQLVHAQERAAHEGLADRVEFIDDDYRNVTGQFDAFVSVGMLEHVGLHHFHSLADVLRRTLRRDSGRGLLHFIGRDHPRPLNVWIRRRIFPGAYPPTLAELTTGILVPAGMSIIDVENLRLHYARTLAHWSERFAAASERVRASYGDEFQRAWELYLAGSQAAFATGWMQLFQVVFAPRESSAPVWTRADRDARGRGAAA
jgi:cyclopropane-fatty-acyl-phospholipid synthase